jgi:uroporphyrinogen decarboxylase
MGMRLEMVESRGPLLHDPLRTADQVTALRVVDPEKHLRYVLDAIALTRRMLADRVPLIGFSGAPWTLASYMVEGGGSKEFGQIKKMMLDAPETLKALLRTLGESVRLYLEAQIAAGAQAVQIFDTWAGILPPDHFRMFCLDPIADIVARLHRSGQPVIVFCKGANHALRELSQIGADVIAVDWTVDLADAREITGDRVALQGNLDPSFLYATPEAIRREAIAVLRKYGHGTGHVFNLGHGILPDIPVDNVRALVRTVREESPRYHAQA